MVILPKKPSYDLPEGHYRAELKDTIKLTGSEGNGLRLVFFIKSLTHPRKLYLAGKNYPLQDATKLAMDLDSWLGDELVNLTDKNGAISIEMIENLKGLEADLDVVLIHNDEYTNAFRHVVRILPPGDLVHCVTEAA